jgi:hypothetical protein
VPDAKPDEPRRTFMFGHNERSSERTRFKALSLKAVE